MFTTLALFALFTIGSAEGGCGETGSPTHCTVGGKVGTCTGSTCGAYDALCGSADVGDYCGNAAGSVQGRCLATGKCESVQKLCGTRTTGACKSDANIIGNCDSSNACIDATGCTVADSDCADSTDTLSGKCTTGNKCKYVETVQIEFTVRAEKTEEERSATVAKAIIARNDLDLSCSGVAGDKPSNATSATCPKTPGEDCVVQCSPNFSNKSFTKKCADTGKYTGVLGSCDASCPVVVADTLNRRTGVLEKVLGTIANGRLICDTVFSGGKCKLKCNTNYRVKTETTYTCDGSRWVDGAAPGECELYANVFGSATVKLGADDKLSKVTSLTDEVFKQKFRASVATIAGVLEQNVTITDISPAPGGDNRRLQETTVKVDYTIQAGKDDPDGRLLVGAPLRGIR